MIKIPLGDSGAVLAATEGDFDEGGFAFAAFGSQFFAKGVAEEFESVLLLRMPT